MNDFNFFSTFEKDRQQKKSKTRRTNGVIIGVILVIVLFYGSLGARIGFNIYKTNAGEAYLNSPEVATKLGDIQAKKMATANLKTYTVEVNSAKQKIALTNKVSSALLDTVQKAIPVTVILSNLEIRDYQVSIAGTAPQMTVTAELVHNLEATGLFTRVHVNSIGSDATSSTYKFNIICDVKEVAVQ